MIIPYCFGFGLVYFHRYAYIGYAFAGHFAHAGQCPAAVLLCFLHLWHYRSTAMAGHFKAAMCARSARLYTSAIKVSFKLFKILFVFSNEFKAFKLYRSITVNRNFKTVLTNLKRNCNHYE